ncbi:AAA family ATPase [Candidatus Gracilibacteria bacterium]|nr:AAA family ATPase [Candidatus Gracilibacteria bacterium]NJP21484.1 AAA family ATPase [Hydrococcus sp. CRU_1_1]
MNKPGLFIVTGRPGSGKTTLAHILAKKVGCPAICRDEIKEGFVNTMNSSHESLGNNVNKEIYDIFFGVLNYLISNKISIVAEAAFQHKLWLPQLEPLIDKSRMRIIVCTIDRNLARSRFIQRGLSDPNRIRFHGDKGIRAAINGNEMPIGDYPSFVTLRNQFIINKLVYPEE